jgi:type IV pilus assembly protein PilF
MNSIIFRLSGIVLALVLSACSSMQSSGDAQRAKRISDANLQLGIAYMRQGDMDTAMAKLKKALEEEPGSASANGAIAVLYDRIGEGKLAEKHFERALSASPNDPELHNNYGGYLCRKGEYTRALKQFDDAANEPLYPGIAAALTNAGICAAKIPDAKQEEDYFRKALDHDPKFPYALLQMANLMLTRGNYLAARGYIQRFDAVSAPTAESLWLGVRIENKLGDQSASGSYALQLRNNFPDTKQAESLKEWENEQRRQQ